MCYANHYVYVIRDILCSKADLYALYGRITPRIHYTNFQFLIGDVLPPTVCRISKPNVSQRYTELVERNTDAKIIYEGKIT